MKNIDYFSKYQKYKQKFLTLKKIMTGGFFLVNDKFLMSSPADKEKYIREYTPEKKSEFIERSLSYSQAYTHFYTNLTEYIYRTYPFAGSNPIDPINSWKISLYGCSDDPSERFAFNPSRFQQSQDRNLLSTIQMFARMGGIDSVPPLKPKGIWASELLTGDRSLDDRTWIANKMDWEQKTRPGNCNGFLIIRLNPERTLTLTSREDFKRFSDEFTFKELGETKKFINWFNVSQKYGALNLPDGAHNEDWFENWDTASSVIWNNSAVLEYHYITLSELENDYKKYMYDSEELFHR